VWYEPADASKMRKPFDADCFTALHTISPNINEFMALQQLLPDYYDLPAG
jgi:hypothetical protein